MSTITISLSGSSVINGTKTYTISDTDVTNLVNWAEVFFAPPAPSPPLTQAQALVAWTQWVINMTIGYEHGYRSGNASQNAVANTPPMTIS